MSRCKFKGKNTATHKWVFGYYLEVDGVPYILQEGNRLNDIVQVEPTSVCREMWFCDNFGIPIFEDDIVEKYGKCGLEYTGVVKYDVFNRDRNGDVYGFAVKDKEGNQREWSSTGYLKVIGNVHDGEWKP